MLLGPLAKLSDLRVWTAIYISLLNSWWRLMIEIMIIILSCCGMMTIIVNATVLSNHIICILINYILIYHVGVFLIHKWPTNIVPKLKYWESWGFSKILEWTGPTWQVECWRGEGSPRPLKYGISQSLQSLTVCNHLYIRLNNKLVQPNIDPLEEIGWRY